MITRIRVVGIKPNSIDEYKVIARDWQKLINKHGGNVLGFYFDEKNSKVTGIAEYKSRNDLDRIRKLCEQEESYRGESDA